MKIWSLRSLILGSVLIASFLLCIAVFPATLKFYAYVAAFFLAGFAIWVIGHIKKLSVNPDYKNEQKLAFQNATFSWSGFETSGIILFCAGILLLSIQLL